ncbi:head GIN domain-containing protein [Mucilaginibacter terrae]|uniref:head GIN domain-containing protein n=1 Tax=Mucilaginibacter terrae TaxID=1955052 RepID=UPI003624EFC8
MKKHISFIAIILAGISLSIISSCHMGCIKGSGNKVTENRKIANFSKIDISGGFKINIKQDSSLSLTVMADDNIMKYVRTQVNGNKLRIYTRKDFCGDGPIIVNVGIKYLEEIKSAGAVELTAEGRINVQNINLDFSGASKIDMDLSAAEVRTEARGATEIFLKGQAASHHVKVSGVGKLHALEFIVGNYNINSSGSSNCQINVLKELKTDTKGVSAIEYRGNPSKVEEHKSGASSLNKVQ